MSNSDGLIRSYVDRILRLKDEVKAVNDDIREIYAEAKGEGFDKTALGKLVTIVQKRNENPAAVDEADAILGLYLEAYYGPSRTHAHAREGSPEEITLNTSNSGRLPAKQRPEEITPDHDPETGEVIEHTASFPAAVEGPGPTGVIDVGGGGEARSEAAVRTPAVPLRTEAAPREDAVSAASVPVQEPGSEGLGVPGREATLQGPAPEPKRQWTHADPAHPDCLNPSQCGGFSNFARCDACKAAANMQVA